MKSPLLSIALFLLTPAFALAGVKIDDARLGASLGGWSKRSGKAAEYDLSGASYRTYKPEVSPTPDGGIFVSVRIDHVRGWLSSDDHAMLEITVDGKGGIVCAQSNIAIQGRSITSDVILGTNEAGQQAVGMDRAVQIGTDLVANLSAKLLREKIVEAGRVSFPAAVRHNYNLLFQAIEVEKPPPTATVVPMEAHEDAPVVNEAPGLTPVMSGDAEVVPTTKVEEKPPEEKKPEAKPRDEKKAVDPSHPDLEIKAYTTPRSGPVKPKS